MRLSSILSSCLGNILEWYDFGLFAIFAPVFGELFFPGTDPYATVIATYLLFAIGFFCRPLGALIFGYLGDKWGRAKTIRLSILMISLPTLIIGCLPEYHRVGILAPILLLFTRVWQGISLGGEYSGNIIYLGEIAPSKFKSFFTSLPAVGANLGIVAAMLVGSLSGYIFNDATFKSWGWRIPYLVSGIFCVVIYIVRLKLEETPVFLEMQKKHMTAQNPVITTFKKHRLELLRLIGLTCMGTTFYYFCFVYLPVLLQQDYKYSLLKTIHMETIFITLMLFLVPLAGLLNDYLGRYRMLVFNAIVISISIIPGLYFLNTNITFLMISIFLFFTLVSSLEQGTTPAIIVENFPAAERYTGLSFAYNITNGFLGGSIPLICAWLFKASHSMIVLGVYVSVWALITLIVSVVLYRKKSFVKA